MARHREVLERRCVTYQQQEAAHGAANEERGTPSQHATQRQIGLSASRVVVPPALYTRRADAGSSLRTKIAVLHVRLVRCSVDELNMTRTRFFFSLVRHVAAEHPSCRGNAFASAPLSINILES